MATLSIVNPVATPKKESVSAEYYPIPPRLDSIAGKTIGLFWNGKNGGQYAPRTCSPAGNPSPAKKRWKGDWSMKS